MKSLFGISVAASLIAISSGGQAFGQVGTPLWRNLTIGMSKEDYKKALPENQFDLTPECRVTLYAKFPNGGLSSVMLSPKWVLAKNKCVESLMLTLAEKYGTPSQSAYHDPGNTFTPAIDYSVYKWRKGLVEVELRSDSVGRNWNLWYRVADAAYESGPQVIDGM
jgi:hypothetical protein